MMTPARLFLVMTLLAASAAGAAEDSKPADKEEKKPGFFGRMSDKVTRVFTGSKKEDSEPPKEAPKPPAPEPKAKPKAAPKAAPKTEPKAKPKPKTDDKPAPTTKSADKPAEKKPEGKPPASKPADKKETADAKKSPATKKPETKPADAKTAGTQGKESKPEEKSAEKPAEQKMADTKPADAAEPPADFVGPPAPPSDKPATVAKTDEKKDDGKKPEEPKKQASDKPLAAGEFDDISAAFGSKMDTPPASKSSAPEKPPAEITAPTLPPPPKLPTADTAWDVTKIDGHDYVTADNIQRFYQFNTLKRDGKNVWMRSPIYIFKAQIGSQDLLINNTKFVLSYPVAESKGKALISRLDLAKLIDPVLRPDHIYSGETFDTVVIDAGHGGHDSGAKGIYGYEKDYTLKMALALDGALKQRGFKTVLTRSTDEFITLPGRVEIANATPRSIFISLHFNSSGSAAAGVETWALSPAGASSTFMGQRGWDNSTFTGNRRDSENIALATAVHAMVVHNLGALADRGMVERGSMDRGIKRARWTVLTGCNRPGILFEGGFVTNTSEGRLIAAETYRTYLCNAIADAVVNYRRALHPSTAQPALKRR